MTDHLLLASDVLSAPCSVCGQWPESLHLVGVTAFCAADCPECKPDKAWLDRAPAEAITNSTQENLF